MTRPTERAAGGSWMQLRTLLLQISDRQLTVGFGIAIARVAGFLTGAVVARALGPDRFAAYSIAFTVFSSLVPLSSFADTWMVSRWDTHDHAVLGRTVWRIKTGITGALLVGLLAFGWWQPEWPAHIGIDAPLLLIAVAASGAGALTTAAASWFQANQKFRGYAVLIAVPSLLALAAASFLRWYNLSTPLPYVAALAIAYTPSTAVAYRLLRHGSVHSGERRLLAQEALTFGGWVTIGSLAYVVFQRVDMFLLASTGAPLDVGLYGAAVRLSMIGALFGNTLTTVLMPIGSRAATWSDPHARRAYLQESVLTVALMTLACGMIIIATRSVVTLVFGPDFGEATSFARVLLVAQVVLIAQLPFYFAMYAGEGTRWIAGLGMLQAGVAIMSGYLMIHRYGATGAAWSNLVTYVVGALGVIAFHARPSRRRTR